MLHSLVLLNKFKKLPLLARILLGLLHDGLRHFSIGHFDAGFHADIGQQQAKTHPAFGKRVMFGSGLDFVMIMPFDLRVVFMPKLMRNLFCLGFDQGRWQIEIYHFIKRVQQAPFGNSPSRAGIFIFEPLGHLGLQRL